MVLRRKRFIKGVRDVIRATTAAEDTETYEVAPAKNMTKKEQERTYNYPRWKQR